MKLNEFVHHNLKSRSILNESWELLSESQKIYIGRWEKELWPLMEQLNFLIEADLTADQIEQLFTNIETAATQAGSNKTKVGQAASGAATAGKATADVAKKVSAEIKKLLVRAKNSGPIKNMDAQFDRLRSQVSDSVQSIPGGDKILAAVDKWKEFGQKNPVKQAFIIGAMTSLLAFASGGVMSGAAIGFFVRAANNTIKGDQLTTVLRKGVRGAAIGAVAGALGSAFSGSADVADSGADVADSGADVADSGADVADSGADAVAADSPEAETSDTVTFQGGEGVEYDKQKLIQAAQNAMSEYGAEDTDAIRQAVVDEIYKQAEEQGTAPDFMIGDEIRTWIDAGISNGEGIFGELQDAAAGANTQINESIQTQLSETQVLFLFEGIMDKIKGAASSAADKAKDVAKSAIGKGVGKAKQVGKDITTKVTANKLMRAWEKAGKPTDSNEIASILSQVGVDQEILSDVYDQMNIPFDPETLEQPAQQQQQQQQQPAQQQQQQPAQQQQQQPAQSGGQWTDANELVEFLKAALKKLREKAPETYQRIASEVLGK